MSCEKPKRYSNSSYDYAFECPCDYKTKSKCQKQTEMLGRLHKKKCKIWIGVVEEYTDTIKKFDKQGRQSKELVLNKRYEATQPNLLKK